MHYKLIRLAIAMSTALIALSAIAGGLTLLLGTYQGGALIEAGGNAHFPLTWLQNTPFSDYTVPALVLIVVVGGSSLFAAMTIFTTRETGVLASLAAGVIMAGYMIGEVGLLRQGVSWIEAVFFGLGLLIFTLAATLGVKEHSDQSFLSKQN